MGFHDRNRIQNNLIMDLDIRFEDMRSYSEYLVMNDKRAARMIKDLLRLQPILKVAGTTDEPGALYFWTAPKQGQYEMKTAYLTDRRWLQAGEIVFVTDETQIKLIRV